MRHSEGAFEGYYDLFRIFLVSPCFNDTNRRYSSDQWYVKSLCLYLETANEVISCEQLIEYEFKCVLPAGLI